MHLETFSISDEAMEDKNQYFRIQEQVTKVSWYIILHIFVCSTFIDSIHESIRIKKVKTEHAMHS